MAEYKSVVITNKKARRNYEILDTIETGIELEGTEVKSIRMSKANLSDAYARIIDGELYLHNFHISPYDFGNRFNHKPLRVKKLLAHKREIRKLQSMLDEKGYTIIPLKLYFKRGWVKIELGIGRGKKLHDKRTDLKKRDDQREMARAMKKR